jgi:methyl-accepting chemotaxis protein
MKWSELSIPKKILFGFSITIFAIVVIAIVNFVGVGGIVGNASEVIEGNKLRGELVQREVDHLNWAMAVNNLLTDDKIVTLEVETDHRKCAFGRFLYSEKRKNAEKLVPSLAPLFQSIEEPHRKLHQSAISIKKAFKPADPTLPGYLAEKEVDHLSWMAKISTLFLANQKELLITTDDHKCDFGKWLHGEGASKAASLDPELSSLIEAIKEPHKRLHDSAANIRDTYKSEHPGLLETLMVRLDDHRRWAAQVSTKIMKGDRRLGVSTDPAKCAFGKFLVSEKASVWMEKFPELKEHLQDSKGPHNRLHRSAIEIERALSRGQKTRAEKIYYSKTIPALKQLEATFLSAINAEKNLIIANKKAL